ncbi:MAG TPA: alpha-glucosidase [Spirochaetia bacterium]|nr:alpha-glucosidase [Spirochaetia bacterium]
MSTPLLESDNDGGFRIILDGKAMIEHGRRLPLFAVGSGSATYFMQHGNFRMTERRSRKSECRELSAIIGDDGVIRITGAHPNLAVEVRSEANALVLRFVEVASWVNRLWIRVAADPGDHPCGCGEQFSRIDLKGSRVPLWTSEQGVGRGHDAITLYANVHSGSGGSWHSTYFPVPAYVTDRGRFVFADTDAYSVFSFHRAWTEIYTRQIPKEVVVGHCGSMAGAQSALSARLGRQPPPPEWVFDGIWLGVQGGREKVEQKLHSARNAGVPVAALWAQDWEGKRETAFGRQLMWDWVYHDRMYPDLPGYIRTLNGRGIRLLGYINPFLALDGSLYKEASAKGYCVKDRTGADYPVVVTTFPAAIVDLTNPQAFTWIKEVIKTNLIGIGLSGWMCDFGEYLPTDAIMHSGESAELVHNRFPALWARANREAVEEAGKLGDVIFFMRAGYTGSTRWSTAFWAGDQLANWSRNDGLPSVIPAAISLGCVGGGIWHTDLGGYTSLAWVRRSKELFMRWAELAAFTPIMRNHEGNRPDINWQFDSDGETLAHLARMSGVYVALKEYHRHLMEEYQSTGLPPIRHPAVHYEQDETLWKIRDQYLYGRDLLVCPVVRKGRRTRSAYLPNDNWVHLFSGKEYGPGRVRVDAPLGTPPVFYRAGSSFAPLFRTFAL